MSKLSYLLDFFYEIDNMNDISQDEEIDKTRNELQNKVSRLLGQYLLKGYRMLNEVCDHCDTVLMQNKETAQKYCVACSEIYGEIVGKLPDENEQAGNSTSPVQQVMSLGTVSSFRVAEEALCKRLEWAARTLAHEETNMDKCERLVNFMKNVSDALVAVNTAANKTVPHHGNGIASL